MNPLSLRDDLRKFLNSDQVTLAEIERKTTLNRSWLSKFRRGELNNPTIEQLAELHKFQASRKGGIRSTPRRSSRATED